MRAVSILGEGTSWTEHSLKIRIGGRSPARRLVAGLLFTASRTEPASYAYTSRMFRKRGWARDRESSAACSMSLSASPAVTHRSNTTPHGHDTVIRYSPTRAQWLARKSAVRAVVVDEFLKVGEEVHWVHKMSSSVSTTAQPSFLKEGSRRWRRSTRRLSTPANVS
jgi:hypothetical protein